MEEEKWYQLLGIYVKEYRMYILMPAVYIFIFGTVCFLYDLEMEAVLYAGALSVLLTAGVLACSVAVGCRAHGRRRRILKNVGISLEELPEPGSWAEADYQDMLRKLKAEYDEALILWQNERRESMDYYTTWVHQIKTPISVMGMMLQGEDTDKNRQLLAELFRIEQYVGMALNWLRLGSDSTDFVFREYELDGIIRQAIRKYAPQFIRNRIRLFYEPAEIRVLTDEKWLLFIIEQLLSNVVKYAGEGTVSIAVTGEVLSIADTGIGIAQEDVPRIFEKGFTGYNGRADKKSTGLGLYLCRLTADRLSHKISVESRPGQGTTFYLDLHRDRLEVE